MGANLKKILSIALTLTLCFGMVACSTKGGKSSMGRYVEEKYELPEGVEVQNLSLLENDKIGMIGYSTDDFVPVFFISEDGGKTWTKNDFKLPKEEGKETYFNSIGYLNDETILLSYYFQEQLNENESKELITESSYENPKYKYGTVDKEGNLKEIDLDFSVYNDDEESTDGSYSNFKSSLSGDVFFSTGSNNEKIVQFDGKTFEEKHVYEGEEWINDFFIVGDSLIIYDFDSLVEYDITSGKKKGNLEALEKATISETSNYYPTFINSGSKDKIYYYNTLGLYEYDMKSENAKQIIDSAISSFGDSEMSLISFIEKSNGEFLAIFNNWSNNDSNGAIINFVYDKNIPSVPENQIVVYSLLENYSIRQAISSYAKEHPDVYVKYEVGLNYGDGKTQSDAIKTLNTEIMSGHGPDVIILDGLSAESYIKKGLLEDISDVINPLVESKTIFKNIADAYKIDGKIYQIATSFKYPILLGNKDDIASVSDLNSLVEVTKKLSNQKDKRIFDNYFTPSSLVYSLYYLYGSDWLNKDNNINEDALMNFFEKANEIYSEIKINEEAYIKTMEDKYSSLNEDEAVFDSVEAEEEIVEDDEEDYEDIYSEYDLQYYLNPSIYPDSFLFERNSLLALGGLAGSYDYGSMITLLNNSPEIDYKVLSRGQENIFIPSIIVGINSKGKNKEQAKEIIKSLITSKSNEIYSNYGFSININKFENDFSIERLKEERYELEFDQATNHYVQGTTGWSDQFGNSKEVKVLYPNDEDVNRLRSEIESLNVATTVNTILLKEVAKQFDLYTQGKISLEDAINEVIDNLDLYLSE
ncbi:ABC transporter substrate-binding protein [uncultured Clostridium sp.]|uniref:ABC transporter substrate-binding protein n=1 Tax=uncultured Clostridium sp. TaxID=59620 RepID=UPI00260F8816|nr:extracellular solute-binding protein [uncultured Clostridium sp.]